MPNDEPRAEYAYQAAQCFWLRCHGAENGVLRNHGEEGHVICRPALALFVLL